MLASRRVASPTGGNANSIGSGALVQNNRIADKPPDRYIPMAGSKYGLVANEYDKNFYAQCSYIAARTLVRCKQIRSKEALARNDGICEMHEKFCATLKELSNKDRLRQESEFVTKRRRNSMVIRTQDYVTEEDGSLYPVPDSNSTIPNYLAFEDDNIYMLRDAETLTVKEALKLQLALTKNEIANLEEVRALAKEDAGRFYPVLMDPTRTKRKYVNLDKVQEKAYEANMHYAKAHISLNELFTRPQLEKPSFTPRCIHGLENKTDDETVLNVMMELVARTCEDGECIKEDVNRCKNNTVLTSSYCFEHILLDKLQRAYVACCRCAAPCINLGHENPLCTGHLAILNKMRKENEYEMRYAPKSPAFVQKVVVDEEEGRNPHAADQAARLLQMQKITPAGQSSSALSGRARYTLQGVGGSNVSVQQRQQNAQQLAFINSIQQQQLSIQQTGQQQSQVIPTTTHQVKTFPRSRGGRRNENADQYQTCARARPFDRDTFGKKEEKHPHQPGSSFSSTVQKSTMLTATMPSPIVRPVGNGPPGSALYRTVGGPLPKPPQIIQVQGPLQSSTGLTTNHIQTTAIGGQRVLQRAHHVALPSEMQRQGPRPELIQQTVAAIEDPDLLEEDRKTPPAGDDIGMVRQYGRGRGGGQGRKSAGAGRGITSAAARPTGVPPTALGNRPNIIRAPIRYMTTQRGGSAQTQKPTVNTTTAQGQISPMSVRAQGQGQMPTEQTSQPPVSELSQAITSQEQQGEPAAQAHGPLPTATAAQLQSFIMQQVQLGQMQQAANYSKPLGTTSLNAPLAPPLAGMSSEEMTRHLEANMSNIQDMPLKDLVSHFTKQHHFKFEGHADVAGSSVSTSRMEPSGRGRQSSSSASTLSATSTIASIPVELPEINLPKTRPQPPHRLLSNTPRIIPLERASIPAAGSSTTNIRSTDPSSALTNHPEGMDGAHRPLITTPQPPVLKPQHAPKQASHPTGMRTRKSESKEKERESVVGRDSASRSSSRASSAMSSEQDELAQERRASLRARPTPSVPPLQKKKPAKRAAQDKPSPRGSASKRGRRGSKNEGDEMPVLSQQMDPLLMLAETAGRMDKRGGNSEGALIKSPDEEFEEEL